MKKLCFLLVFLLLSALFSACSSRSSIGIIGGADGPTSIFVADAQNESSIITAEDAKAIALSHAGLTAEQADLVRSFIEADDGILLYEVEILVGSTEYDYEINAVTGEILSFEKESTY